MLYHTCGIYHVKGRADCVVTSFRLFFVGRERRHPGVGADGKAWNLCGSLGAARGTGGGYVCDGLLLGASAALRSH